MTLNLIHNSLIAIHILAVIAWMAGLLYLPRLYVYHADALAGSELDKTFQKMESNLYRLIMNPSMMVVWLLGIALVWFDAKNYWGMPLLGSAWLSTKFVGVILLTAFHLFLSVARKRFVAGANTRSARFWRMVNEIPFVLAIIMVVAAVTKFGDVRFGG